MEETPPEDVEPDVTTHDPAATPHGPLAALDEILRRPRAIFERSRRAGDPSILWLALAAVACFALYGAASGFFQGGAQILVAAFKAPLILIASLALCTPSFYVLSSLAGIEVTSRWLSAALIGLAGILGLLLVALMPITWLFSVSSTSLAFIAVLQLLVWIVAVHFGYRFLAAGFRRRDADEAPDIGGARPSIAWMVLLVVVSLQVASQLRPVLWRAEGEALFAPRRMFFVEHFFRVAAGEDKTREARAERN